MAVVLETTLGDITIDLYIQQRPKACINFLKLCKVKYYNFNLFHTVNQGFIAQTGDPTGSRIGGESIWGVMEGPLKRYFVAEDSPRIKHTTTGLVSFVGDKDNMIGSQFFITLAPDLTYLDAQHCVFGEVAEGFEVLRLLNEAICDNDHRPYQDIRITHTVVLEDPFPDPENLKVPDASPEPTAERLQGGRIAPDEDIDETQGKSAQEVLEVIAEKEAKARATILEMIGDIPDADMAPPENVLFVCKLNPVTNDDDLEIIFSRFGKIKSCEVIRDKKTGDSLQYAFVEFEEQKSCEDAYFKMDNVLIDDRRIHVDFSQSVAKVKWHGKGRGVTHFDERGERQKDDPRNDIGQGRYRDEKKNNRLVDDVKENRRNDQNYPKERYRNGNQRNRQDNTREPRDIQQRERRDDRSYREERYRHEQSERYRPNNYPRERRNDYYEPSRRRDNRYDERRHREDDRSRNNQRSRQIETRKYEDEKQRNKKYKDESEKDIKQNKPAKKKNRRESTSDDESSSEEEQIKKPKKSKKKKSKKRQSSSESDSESDKPKKKKSKKKRQSSSDSESDSDSESEHKKSKKKKKKKSKKTQSSSSDSESDTPKKKKSRKR